MYKRGKNIKKPKYNYQATQEGKYKKKKETQMRYWTDEA